jgi:hypothetical protein
MSIERPRFLLGKPSTEPQILALLQRFGAKVPLREKGDVDAWVDLDGLGVGLVFTDEAHLKGNRRSATGEGGLVLSCVTYYGPKDEAASTFRGALPLGVDFAQSRADLSARLGEPELYIDRLCQDRWTIEGAWYFAEYTDELDALLTFSVQLPAF